MFSLAHLLMLDLEEYTSPQITLEAVRILQQTCVELTQGQYLDISYEDKESLKMEDYWRMIRGKTAALLGTCTELGALIAGTSQEKQRHYRAFGINLGLAFQVLDDILGTHIDRSIHEVMDEILAHELSPSDGVRRDASRVSGIRIGLCSRKFSFFFC